MMCNGGTALEERPRVRSAATLQDILAARGSLRSLTHEAVLAQWSEGKLRDGKLTFTLTWMDGATSRLVLEVDARCLSCVDLLVGVADRARARDLLSLLRSPDADDGIPSQQLHVFVHRSALTLRYWVSERGFANDTERVVRTASRLRESVREHFGERHLPPVALIGAKAEA